MLSWSPAECSMHVCMNSFSNTISAIWGYLIHTLSTAQALKGEGIMGQGLLVYVWTICFALWTTMGMIGCFGDGEPEWRGSPGLWDACSNYASSRVWLSLLLIQYEMWSCLVTCMNKSFECVTHGPLYHGCIVSSYIAREIKIEKTGAVRDGEGQRNETKQTKCVRRGTKHDRGMRWSRQKV